MTAEQSQAVQNVSELVRKGQLPGKKCLGCQGEDSELIPMYALCERRKSRMPTKERKKQVFYTLLMIVGLLFFGPIGQIAVVALFLFRIARSKGLTVVEGKDLLLPVPLRFCDSCRENAKEGGGREFATFAYQFLYAVGIGALFAWGVLHKLDWKWGVSCLVAAMIINGLVRWSRRKSPDGNRALLESVSEYGELLTVFRKAEIWSTVPPALEDAVPEWARGKEGEKVETA